MLMAASKEGTAIPSRGARVWRHPRAPGSSTCLALPLAFWVEPRSCHCHKEPEGTVETQETSRLLQADGSGDSGSDRVMWVTLQAAAEGSPMSTTWTTKPLCGSQSPCHSVPPREAQKCLFELLPSLQVRRRDRHSAGEGFSRSGRGP
jgi:hypothetical protein